MDAGRGDGVKAYRVYENQWGFEDKVRYHLSPEAANTDHNARVIESHSRTDLVFRNDLDGKDPIRDEDHPDHIRRTWVCFWSTWSNENGTESDREAYEIITDEIAIEEGGDGE